MKVGINVIGKTIAKSAVVLTAAFIFICTSDLFAQQRVSPYDSIDFELTSIASKTFSFEASQGEVIEFTISHTSTSLKAIILSPRGKKVFSITSPTLLTGTLPVSFRASEGGVFKVTLETERPGKTIGQVKLNYISKRPYRADDEDRLKAFTLISDAQETIQSFYKLTADRSKKDIAKQNLTEAIKLCEKTRDRRCIAMAALDLGQFEYDELSDFAAAESAFRKSIGEYTSLSDLAGESFGKGRMALVISLARGRDPEVMKLLDEAIAAAKAAADPYMEARVLTFKGRILRDWGEGGKGFELLKDAVAKAGDGDLEGRLRALIYTASTAGALIDRSYSVYLGQAFDLMSRLDGRMHPTFQPWILNQKAGLAVDRGDIREYELLTNRAIAGAEALGQKRLLALYLYSAATVYLNLKNPQKAFPYLVRSLVIYEEAVPREAQSIYTAMGRYYIETKNFAKAKEFLFKAVNLNEKNQDKYAASISLNFLSDVEIKLGEYASALRSAEKSYNYSLLLRENYFTAVTLNGFDLSLLRDSSERMITVLYYLYDQTREIQYLDRALEIQEIAISRSLINTVRDSGFNLTTAVDKEQLRTISDLQTAISDLEIRVQGSNSRNPELNDALLKKLIEYDGVLDKVRRANPNASLFNELIHISADQIRSLLDENTVLIQYSIKASASHVWVISNKDSKFYLLGKKDEINNLTNDFKKDISDYSSNSISSGAISGSKLFDAVLKPVIKDIKAFKRVLIVPDEDLVAAPFGAIPLPSQGRQKYLAEEFEIGILPSVSTLLALRGIIREKPKANSQELVAVIADPVYDLSDDRLSRKGLKTISNNTSSVSAVISGSKVSRLTRLPFTNVEAREIAGLAASKIKIFAGLDAKRDTVLNGSVSNYRIVHFATHGFLNTSSPELSSLALSMYDANGYQQNGFLRAIDIYSLRLKADMVVLGGCQTAGIAQIRGDGLAGLTRGFMYAGVPTVMASLWKVDDAATSYFMRYFYEALLTKGMTPIGALRDAQIRFINSSRWSSPRYWAAFTVQGEYETTFKE